jgi:hypothetical protein
LLLHRKVIIIEIGKSPAPFFRLLKTFTAVKKAGEKAVPSSVAGYHEAKSGTTTTNSINKFQSLSVYVCWPDKWQSIHLSLTFFFFFVKKKENNGLQKTEYLCFFALILSTP